MNEEAFAHNEEENDDSNGSYKVWVKTLRNKVLYAFSTHIYIIADQ